MRKAYRSVREFYPFYLSEHSRPACRPLHVIGRGLSFVTACGLIIARNWFRPCTVPLIKCGCAVIGHFFSGKNNSATFAYPFYSFAGDWIMFKDVLTRKLKW